MGAASSSLWSKARRIAASQGARGMFEELTARLRYRVSAQARTVPYHVFRTLDWDRRRGVETETPVRLENLDFDTPSLKHAQFYLPTNLWTFREMIGELTDFGVRPRAFSLVDFGCGKGRVLLMALEAGFRVVIGVEFAPDLARIASDNLRAYRGRRQGATVLCMDAVDLPIPTGPVVLFLFNPFAGPVLEAVADNIERSFIEERRPMFVVHLYPQPESPFDRGAPFVRVALGPNRAIYRLEADR
jgi:SAM-dependent methyltransferase